MLRETFYLLREQFPAKHYEESSLTIWDERPHGTDITAALGSIRRVVTSSNRTGLMNETEIDDRREKIVLLPIRSSAPTFDKQVFSDFIESALAETEYEIHVHGRDGKVPRPDFDHEYEGIGLKIYGRPYSRPTLWGLVEDVVEFLRDNVPGLGYRQCYFDIKDILPDGTEMIYASGHLSMSSGQSSGSKSQPGASSPASTASAALASVATIEVS